MTKLASSLDKLVSPRHFIGAEAARDEADWVIVGMPYDGTCSYRPGTRFAPGAIREASWGLETYSPIINRDLEDYNINDAGDLDLPFGNRDEVLKLIRLAADDVLEHGQQWAGLGGEH